MTITVTIDTPLGAPGIFAVKYFQNLDLFDPTLLPTASRIVADDIVDAVNGGKLQVRFYSATNDFTTTVVNGEIVVTGGTVTKMEFYGGVIKNGAFLPDVAPGAIAEGFHIDAVPLYAAISNNDLATIDQLIFQADNFQYTGNVGPDTFTAGSKNDTLNGAGGNDTLVGREGNDTITGGAGKDALDGGADNDTVDYSYLISGQNVSLALGAVDVKGNVAQTSSSVTGITGDGDTVKNFENIRGGAGNDTLTGNAGTNSLDGSAGNDKLTGGAGDDTLQGGVGDDMIEGGLGADTLDGGSGNETAGDTISYANSKGAVLVNLGLLSGGAQFVSQNGPAASDADGDNISNFENIIGTKFDDALFGSNGAVVNRIDAGDGNDFVAGGGGADLLIGGAGTNDTLDYHNDITGVTIDLSKQATLAAATGVLTGGTDGVGGDAQGDKFTGFENIAGGIGNDTLTGDGKANIIIGSLGDDTIDGGEGNDTLGGIKLAVGVNSVSDGSNLDSGDDTIFGGDGNDLIFGDNGSDRIDGGAGVDTLSYAPSLVRVVVDLSKQDTTGNADRDFSGAIEQDTSSGIGDSAGDKLAGIENLIGSAFGDVLFGDSGVNMIDGGEGDDVLFGAGGADTLIGGLGNDTVVYGSKSDVAGISITLGKGGAQTTGAGGDAKGDKISGVENITGTSLNDTLVGNELANKLSGGGGNDTISGGGGDDILDGGDGNDVLTAGTGAGQLFGGDGDDIIYAGAGVSESYSGGTTMGVDTGIDTLNFSKVTTTGVTVDLNAQTFSGTGIGGSASGFEILIGTGKDDVLSGLSSSASTIDGGAGNDIITGGTGADKLIGGAGVNTLNYSTDTADGTGVSIDLRTQATFDARYSVVIPAGKTLANFQQHGGGAEGDLISGFANVVGSADNDTITGDKNNNVIEGGAGADTLIGGLGVNTVSYASSAGRVFVDLSTSTAQDSSHTFNVFTDGSTSNNDAAGDQLTGFVNVIGSAFSDEMVGNSKANILKGGDDADYFIGARLDTITHLLDTSGAGADTFDGGNGFDRADYSAETAGITITLGKNGVAAKVTGGSANGAAGDTLINIEGVIGGSGNDALTGNTFQHDLSGGDGNDTIYAFASSSSSYSGDAGSDTLNFSKLTTGVTVDFSAGHSSASAAGFSASVFFFEVAVGTAFADSITSDDNQGMTIDGGAGDDFLFGGAGHDILIGGLGNDTFDDFGFDGVGDDFIGGAGVDTVYYSGIGAITVDLSKQFNADAKGMIVATPGAIVASGGLAQGDRLSGIENVTGGDAADTITGDKNANMIQGGAGADLLIGGLGIDTVSYDLSNGPVVVDLTKQGTSTATGAANPGTATAQSGGSGDDVGDNLYGFENVTGSFFYGDTLIGNAGANILMGSGGNDTLIGGAGADTLNGGADFDIVDYSAITKNITLTLASGSATSAAVVSAGSDANGDKLIGIERVDAGSGADNLTGNDQQHTFLGGDGNDILTGGGGSSQLFGDAGDDIIYASVGAVEHYEGGAGGETKGDTLNFTKITAFGVNADLFSGNFNGINTSAIGTGTASGFEILIGTSKDDILRAGGGAIVDGGAGNDVIEGNGALIKMIGGAGIDTLSYAHETSDVTVSLAKQVTFGANYSFTPPVGKTINDFYVGTPGSGTSLISGFENITGGSGNDTLIGDKNVNVIEGGAGADNLFGGAGLDTVSYEHSADHVTVDLSKQGTTQADGFTVNVAATAQSGGGDAAGDFLYGFENVTGTGGDDILTGDGFANILKGGAGDDVLKGGAGADTLDGGADTDVADFTDETVGFTLKIGGLNIVATVSGGSAAHAGGDKIVNIEEVDGGHGNDTITASDLGNIIYGHDGNDILTGGKGQDVLVGGSGDDIIYAGLGGGSYSGDSGSGDHAGEVNGDTINFSKITTAGVDANLSTGIVTSTAFAHMDVTDFEIMVGTGKDDILTGNASVATKIDGGAGNDTIKGGTAIDTLKGGAGSDKFVFANAFQGADHIVDFAAGDKIQVSQTGFDGGLGALPTGSLTDLTYFKSAAGSAAVADQAHGQFIYNTATHDLVWDADGTGAGAAVTIAHFDNNYTLKITDLLISA